MSELTDLGFLELSDLIRKHEVLPSEVVGAHVKRAHQINPTINAITDLQSDRALELAAEADNEVKRGTASPRHCVPITVKSSIAAKGFRQECGSELRRGEVAKTDAALVESLALTEATIIGTTNVPEFLMAYETDNAIYGRTSSPVHPDVTPGGSSGGCSAAVASGCSAASFGSDAGGSVRVPAHFCGLYGLKPTPGYIPRTGHWPSVAGPSTLLAGVGPLTKTAEDLDFLLRITAKADSGEISSVPELEERPMETSDMKALRIGWFDHAWDTPVTAETRSAVATAAAALRDRGFRVERIELRGLEQAPKIWWLMFGICLKTLIEKSIPSDYRLHPLAYEAMASHQEEAGTSFEDLLMGWVTQDQLRFRMLQQMQRYPLLLCPVASIPAFRHGERTWSIEGETVTYPRPFVYSQVFNILGLPAASVPVSESKEGLPIGVQVAGRPYEDRLVTALVRELAAGLGQK